MLHHERALRHADGVLKIRYILRPPGRITIDYHDPRNAAPKPSQLFPFESLAAWLSGDGDNPNPEYPQAQAQGLFNAGWAAAAVCDVNPDISHDYSQARQTKAFG